MSALIARGLGRLYGLVFQGFLWAGGVSRGPGHLRGQGSCSCRIDGTGAHAVSVLLGCCLPMLMRHFQIPIRMHEAPLASLFARLRPCAAALVRSWRTRLRPSLHFVRFSRKRLRGYPHPPRNVNGTPLRGRLDNVCVRHCIMQAHLCDYRPPRTWLDDRRWVREQEGAWTLGTPRAEPQPWAVRGASD